MNEQKPDWLKTFCASNQVEETWYDKTCPIPRYIRWHPSVTEGERETILSQDENLKQQMKQISWFPAVYQFYQLPQTFALKQFAPHLLVSEILILLISCSAYEQAKLYGVDIASALSVICLDPKQNEKVLDLCCSPGGKLMFIHDYIIFNSAKTTNSNSPTKFYISGVDVHHGRLHNCSNLMKKYKISNARLILADGTSWTNEREPIRFKDGRKLRRQLEKTKTISDIPEQGLLLYETYGTFFDLQIQKERQIDENSSLLYKQSVLGKFDKVLVDAECTTDGSIKHVTKIIEKEGWNAVSDLFSAERRDQVVQLQKKLIWNGFQLLKQNGVLIYSTCSFQKEQNEEIVQWLLHEAKEDAKLMHPFDNILHSEMKNSVPYKESIILPNTFRLDPKHSNCSGLFIAKIVRK